MIVTSFLSAIFSEKKILVMKYFLKYPNGQFTGRDISRNLNLNHKTCLKILNQFFDLGLLDKAIIGKAHVFKIRLSFYWTEIIQLMIKKENVIIQTITKDIVNHIGNDIVAIILFGSYVTKTETERSDMDICVVVKRERMLLEKTVHDLEDKLYDTYLCHISFYIVTENDFIKESHPIIKEIKTEGNELWSKQKK